MSFELPTIIQEDDPRLKQPSEDITVFDDDLKTLVDTMLKTVASKRALGLAAVQIGVMKRVIVAHGDGKTHVMVNPVVTRTLNRFVDEREGCLSITHGLYAQVVRRPAKCDITWQDLDGESHSATFTNESARVLQHEIDHINGILITDKPPI